MKLGIANRITVTNLDLDQTVDVRVSYTDIIMAIQSGHVAVAQLWLDSL